MISRDDRQAISLKKWSNTGGKGTLVATTGFGKTRVALKLIKRIQERWGVKPASSNYSQVIVVVDSEPLKNQWTQRLEEWAVESFQVVIINSLINAKWKCELLVLDEVHYYVAEEFGRVYECVDYDFILGLTATIDSSDPKYDIIEKYAPIFDIIPLDECLVNDWVSTFGVYNIPVELTEEEFKNYQFWNKLFHQNWAHFSHDFNLAMVCASTPERLRPNATDKQRRNHTALLDRSHMLGYTPGQVIGLANKWRNAMQQRIAILHNAENKLNMAVELARRCTDRRLLYFSQTIEMTQALNDEINSKIGEICVPYHSNVKSDYVNGKKYGPKRLKAYYIKQFADDSSNIRAVSAARGLDQGIDIPAVDTACCTSGTSETRQMIQRLGRGIRRQENKYAIYIELYIPGTQDEKWLEKRQEDVPENSIFQVNSLDDVPL